MDEAKIPKILGIPPVTSNIAYSVPALFIASLADRADIRPDHHIFQSIQHIAPNRLSSPATSMMNAFVFTRKCSQHRREWNGRNVSNQGLDHRSTSADSHSSEWLKFQSFDSWHQKHSKAMHSAAFNQHSPCTIKGTLHTLTAFNSHHWTYRLVSRCYLECSRTQSRAYLSALRIKPSVQFS